MTGTKIYVRVLPNFNLPAMVAISPHHCMNKKIKEGDDAATWDHRGSSILFETDMVEPPSWYVCRHDCRRSGEDWKSTNYYSDSIHCPEYRCARSLMYLWFYSMFHTHDHPIYLYVIDGSPPLFLRDGLPFMINISHLGILLSTFFLLALLSLGGLLHISQHAPGSLSHLRFDNNLSRCY